jgi:hypothetical protein
MRFLPSASQACETSDSAPVRSQSSNRWQQRAAFGSTSAHSLEFRSAIAMHTSTLRALNSLRPPRL